MKGSHNYFKENRQDLTFLFFLLIMSVFFHINAYSFNKESKNLPLIVSAFTLIVVILELLNHFKKYKLHIKKTELTNINKQENTKDIIVKTNKIFVNFCLFIMFVVLSYLFTFYISTVFFIFLFNFINKYRSSKNILITLFISLLIVIVFHRYLNAFPLARGLFLNLNPIIHKLL